MITLYGNILTSNGKNMLTAVNAGGLGGPDGGPGVVALHTDATLPSTWETFKLILQPGSPPIGQGMKFALLTSSGKYYVTANNGGGIGGPDDQTCPIHTDATTAGAWEFFELLIDDTANPPTVTISLLNMRSLFGSNYLTAVNGGGVSATAKQPIKTDATAVGAWEQFTFSGVIESVQNSRQWFASTNIKGPAQGNIAGSITVNMSSDGSYTFSGQMNNSNWLPYNIMVAAGIQTPSGIRLGFSTTGKIDAGLPWDNNNFSWSISGNNVEIKNNWTDISKSGGIYWNESAALDLPATIAGLETAMNDAIGAAKIVIAIVGLFA